MTFPVFSCPLNMQTVGMESFDFSALLHTQAVLGPVEQKVARANGEIRGNQVTRRNHKGRAVRVSGPTSIRKKK